MWQTEMLSVICTLAIGCFVVWTALNQNRISRDQLKIDLFEKRFAVFKATRELLTQITKKGDV
ncbi:MAG: hypothetical protein ABIK45_01740, partial [Pseudomonadota bacterium]